MDIFTVLISLCLGFAGTLIFGGLLNIPDAGAIIAIAFIGGRIIYLLEKITGIPKNNGEANEKTTVFLFSRNKIPRRILKCFTYYETLCLYGFR